MVNRTRLIIIKYDNRMAKIEAEIRRSSIEKDFRLMNLDYENRRIVVA